MKKSTMTPAKLEANRRNALKSTGPRTFEGKLAIRWNATKHGIFAKNTLIDRGDGMEKEEDFRFLLDNLVKQYKPEGTIEHILIERIASSYWRLGRAQRAEIGELQKTLDRGRRGQRTKDIDEFNRLTSIPDLPQNERTLLYTSNPEGLLKLHSLLKKSKADIEEEERIKDPTLEGLRFLLPRTDLLVTIETLSGTKKEKLLTIDNQIRIIEARYHEKIEESDSRASASFEASMIPKGKAGRTLLRYETAIERQLYRAIRELERLQEIRLFKGSQESKESMKYMYKMQNKPTKRKRHHENHSNNEFQGRKCQEHNGRKPLGGSR
jgi:hypothetical protein